MARYEAEKSLSDGLLQKMFIHRMIIWVERRDCWDRRTRLETGIKGIWELVSRPLYTNPDLGLKWWAKHLDVVNENQIGKFATGS